MSRTSEDLIRAAYGAYTSGDLDALLAEFSPGFEWTYLDPTEEDLQPRTCHGVAELRHALQRQSTQGLRAEIEHIYPNGEQVMVVVHIPGVDALRSRQADDRNFDVFTIRNGAITALRAFRTRDEAMAAAGIDPAR